VQLYVSLRCMQIFNGFCRLYAGGGIMPDSVEEQEWQETVNKMACMQQAIEEAH
jgi:isochorismate synthase